MEIDRNGFRLKIVPVGTPGRVDRLVPHPDALPGDPEEIVEIDWSGEWDPSI